MLFYPQSLDHHAFWFDFSEGGAVEYNHLDCNAALSRRFASLIEGTADVPDDHELPSPEPIPIDNTGHVRANHKIASHDGKLWVGGGRRYTDSPDNLDGNSGTSLLVSSDGSSWSIADNEWEPMTYRDPSSVFYPLPDKGRTAFNFGELGSGDLTVGTGGDSLESPLGFRNGRTVWSASGGMNWSKLADAPLGDWPTLIIGPFLWDSGYRGSIVEGVNFNHTVSGTPYFYRLGGRHNTLAPTTPNDGTFRSADGITWDRLGDTPWSVLQHAAGVSDGTNLYVTGGSESGGDYTKKVYKSTNNGGSWSLVTASADWPARGKHTMAYHDGRLWVIGGKKSNADFPSGTEDVDGYDDLWYSSDGGANWTEDAATLGEPRIYGDAISYGGNLLFYGGDPGYDYSVIDSIWTPAWRYKDSYVDFFSLSV